MIRDFAPKSFGLRPDFHMQAIEARLKHSGQWMFHMPTDQDRQAVVMNYQYINADAQINPDFVVAGTVPKLFGLIHHFENRPKVFQKGNSAKPDRGSQFEVNGFLYNAKKVDVNSRGSLYVELVRADKCTEARCDFFDEIEMFTC